MPVRSRAEKLTRRAELSGAGPAGAGHQPGRLPGATNRFALFGEILIVGLIVTVLSLPVVTLPLALAAGVRHLRRYVRAEGSTLHDVAADLRRGILPSLGVGAAMLLLVAVLMVDIALAADRVVPSSELILAAGVLAAALLALTVVSAASVWEPESGWRVALVSCPRRWRGDPAGAGYLLAAVAFVGVVSWQLPPLAVPGLGCLVLAMVAIPERRAAG